MSKRDAKSAYEEQTGLPLGSLPLVPQDGIREALEKTADALERVRASQRLMGILVIQDVNAAISCARAALSNAAAAPEQATVHRSLNDLRPFDLGAPQPVQQESGVASQKWLDHYNAGPHGNDAADCLAVLLEQMRQRGFDEAKELAAQRVNREFRAELETLTDQLPTVAVKKAGIARLDSLLDAIRALSQAK